MAPHNLPIQLTSFIGRERETAEVKRLLDESRLVTLIGAGGCGKTRLALHLADSLKDSFGDGVWQVEFQTLRDPLLVPQFVAQSLGLHPAPNQSPLELLIDFLERKYLLLILDNCEHLRAACAQIAGALLSAAPRMRILATSRAPLSLPGEAVYAISGLSLPHERTDYSISSAAVRKNAVGNLKKLQQSDAVRLFVERARRIVHSFTLTLANAQSIVEICRRLDGLPLAIELASARVNVLTVQQIADRLDNRFALLNSGQLSSPVRHHRTLRAAMDWSFDLLSPAEKILLRRLAVFAGGCTLDAVEAVCADDLIARGQIPETLFSLVNKSLLVAETLSSGVARYHFLETIREYAQAKLNEAGEATHLRDRFLEHYVVLAEETAPKLRGAYEKLWLSWLEQEQDNLRAALQWALESRKAEMALRLTVALYDFWAMRGYVTEGLEWYVRALEQRDGSESARLQAQAATSVSSLAALSGDAPRAIAYGKEAVSLSEIAGEEAKSLLAMACTAVARGARLTGDYVTAFEYGNRALALSREMDDRFSLGMSLIIQGYIAMELGQFESAHKWMEEGLQVAEQLDDPFRIALVLNFLGDLERCKGNYSRARSRCETSLARFQEVDAKREVASVLHNLAYTFLHQSELERATELFKQSIEIQQVQRNTAGIAECLAGFSAIAVQQNAPEQAARLLAFATELSGKNARTIWAAERMEYEMVLTAIHKQLSPQQFEAAESDGQAWSLEQAIEYAVNLSSKNPSALESKNKFGLSARELEIVVLIAQGKSNSEIAEQLILSKRTVEKHVANILAKLDFTNRTQVARWATENNLTKPKK